ncbi:hypothetical protein N7451_011734 [Penicillium sp. IBT 35674x]|nr:hypothetical protein N7451_011734 [Penicillium sp. IBT 35674x]
MHGVDKDEDGIVVGVRSIEDIGGMLVEVRHHNSDYIEKVALVNKKGKLKVHSIYVVTEYQWNTWTPEHEWIYILYQGRRSADVGIPFRI